MRRSNFHRTATISYPSATTPTTQHHNTTTTTTSKMNYNSKRTPCQKYYDKSAKDVMNKSISATRFVPFRRSSDTTSDSGSDDFKIEPLELSSSFSRSSSESGHSATRFGHVRHYNCTLKNLNETCSNIRDTDTVSSSNASSLPQNESLNDFQSRLALRRKIKTREVFAALEDDRGTDNSCDSTTTKAHQDILRSANLLKQEQIERKDDFASTKKMFHKDGCVSPFGKRFDQGEDDLMNTFDKILQIQDENGDLTKIETNERHDLDYPTSDQQKSSSSIIRSSTEMFFGKSRSSNANKGHGQSASSSPRIRPKTHSQVLKAATSIPSLIFSNKSLRLNKSSNSSSSNNNNSNNSANNSNTNFNYELNSDKLSIGSKKNSLDDDFFTIGSAKTRRSPLRFLGNFVDDKFFRGRWNSAKRAKSTDELTWALANEDIVTSSSSNDMHLLKEAAAAGRTRKKSLGQVTSTHGASAGTNTDDLLANKRRYKIGVDKAKTMSDLICKKLFDENMYNAKKEPVTSSGDVKKRTSSTTSSDLHSISGSSVASLPDHQNCDHHRFHHAPAAEPRAHSQSDFSGEIRAETLAEIEAFEELLKNHLQI